MISDQSPIEFFDSLSVHLGDQSGSGSLKLTAKALKMMVSNRNLLFQGLFSGAMLVFRGVVVPARMK